MKLCSECRTVNGHQANCPEADDYEDREDDLCDYEQRLLSGDRERAEQGDNR